MGIVDRVNFVSKISFLQLVPKLPLKNFAYLRFNGLVAREALVYA